MNNLKKQIEQLLDENKHRLGKYGTISGYLSVTRLLKEMTDDTAILEWRACVGDKEADRITNAALDRGRRMHELIELHYAGVLPELDLTKPGDLHYNKILPLLKPIEPLFVECGLFSDKLELTGRADTIGLYNGALSTIDYKTSKRPKQLQYMKSYGVQVALYSMMFYDMTGTQIKQGVLLNAPDDEDGIDAPTPPQVFTFAVADYIPLAIDIVRRYRKGERKCVLL